jgi:hypothetical protein
MTVPPPPPPPPAHEAGPPAAAWRRTGPSAPGRSNGLAVALSAICAAVLVQAATAGLFLSGTGGGRLVHTWVGSLLPYGALVVALIAVAHHRRGSCPPGVAWATYLLPVLLWVQMALGHVPAAATTAVHVPLGVTLAVYPSVLAMLAWRRPR